MMRPKLRHGTACAAALSLLLGMIPATAGAAPPTGRIEGLLLDVDGRPAAGYQVILVDPAGNPVGASPTSQQGLYSFKELLAGSYAMGIQDPEGAFAPVAAAPVRLEPGQLVRRDVRLLEADPDQVSQALADYYGIRIWWVSRTKKEKFAFTVGVLAGLGLLYYLLRDDDIEITASPMTLNP